MVALDLSDGDRRIDVDRIHDRAQRGTDRRSYDGDRAFLGSAPSRKLIRTAHIHSSGDSGGWRNRAARSRSFVDRRPSLWQTRNYHSTHSAFAGILVSVNLSGFDQGTVRSCNRVMDGYRDLYFRARA